MYSQLPLSSWFLSSFGSDFCHPGLSRLYASAYPLGSTELGLTKAAGETIARFGKFVEEIYCPHSVDGGRWRCTEGNHGEAGARG